MKRIIAIILSVITLFSSMFCLTGCSKNNKDNTLVLGDWLYLICDFFGMETYTSEEPYFKNVEKSNEYFSSFQKAAEWEILEKSDTISSSDIVLWQEALITLVNAGGFLPYDSTDEEKVEFAIENFDNNIRDYWMKRSIKKDEALILLTKAQDLWANKKYDKAIEKYKYNEQVREIANAEQYQKVKENLYVTEKLNEEIQTGNIIILPDNNNKFEKEYKKVISVEKDESTIKIETADVEDISEIYDELYIQETLVPTLENTILYDGNGELISSSGYSSGISQSADKNTLNITTMEYRNSNNNNIINCATGKVSKTFNVQGVEISVDFDGESLKTSLKSDSFFGDSCNFNESFELSNITATPTINWNGIIFKSAGLKIDYNAKNTVGLKYTSKKKLLMVPGTEQENGAWRYNNGNGKFLTNLRKAFQSPLKDENDGGAKTIASKKKIKICSMNIYSVGLAKICLDVNATFKFDGSVSITVTESGSKGIEYKNGNIRFIKSSTSNAEALAQAKLEFTLNMGPALYTVGLKKKLVGAEIKLGAGVNASLKAHLADSQMHLIEELDFNDVAPEDVASAMGGLNIVTTGKDMQAVAEAHGGIYNLDESAEVKLHTDWCIDAKVYGIVKLGLSDEAYLVGLLGNGKKELSIDICNEKNATFLKIHSDSLSGGGTIFELGKKADGNNCTLHYIPFDKATDEEENETIKENETKNNNDEILFGDKLILSTIMVSMEKNQQFAINITQIPEKYAINDIEFVSRDNDVAIVSSDGVINAIDSGNTIIYARTKDGKYTAMVSVIVVSEKKEWTNPLKGVIYEEILDYSKIGVL